MQMKCEVCHKREATVAYTHIVENEKKTVHLCGVCLSQQKVRAGTQSQKTAEAPVMVKKVKAELKQLPKEGEAATQCPECGMTYEEFKKLGRFGCHACYEAFDAQLEQLMKRIHGTSSHHGKGLVKREERSCSEEELQKLQRDLEAAVAAEAYERAAELRDRIRALETETDGVGS
jgi:protein arginine kinase activator